MFEEVVEEFEAPLIIEIGPNNNNNSCSCGRGNNNSSCTGGGAPKK